MATPTEPMTVKSNGSLEITAGFKYTKAQLLDYMGRIKADPASYDVEDKYINPSEGNGIVDAIDELLTLAAKKRVFTLSFGTLEDEPEDQTEEQPEAEADDDAAEVDENDADEDEEDEDEEEGDVGEDAGDEEEDEEPDEAEEPNQVLVDNAYGFEGVLLPINTIYDLLGYIMSVTFKNCPATSTSTARNYYMPLLSLYAKWCRILSPTNDDLKKNKMVHITWFKDTEQPYRILLGSTVGQTDLGAAGIATDNAADSRDLAKQKVIKNDRRNFLTEAGFDAPLSNSKKILTNFGSCAETFFFVYQGREEPRIDMTKVKGLAMIPEKKHPAKDAKYAEKTAATALEPPCSTSCQKLVRQMGTDWKTIFDVEALKTECGV